MRADQSTIRHARGREALLPLDQLPGDLTKAPTWLIEDVKLKGVVSSIIVADNGDEGYEVVDGRRRLAAAREAGLETIPARVFDGAEIGESIPELAVSLNALRATNWVTSYDSVHRMALAGLDVEEIGKRTALTVPTVKALLSIATVHDTILKAMKNGAVRYSVVRMVSRCGKETQRRLVEEVLFVKGTITAKDVRQIAPEFADQEQSEFPEVWAARARHTLEELVKAAPSAVLALSVLRDAVGALEEE